jgi:hypothetical protein
MKFQKCIGRRFDTLKPDHGHKMPEGQMSGGMLWKPNANSRAGWHTHLFEDEGDVYETLPAYDEAGHKHEFRGEFTGAPVALPKSPGVEMGRTDSLNSEGEDWVVRDPSGQELGRGKTKRDALRGLPRKQARRLINAK